MNKAQKPSWQFLRWVAMPFASVIGAFLGAMIYSLMGWLGFQLRGGDASKTSFFFTYFMPISASMFFGGFFSYIVYQISPKYKIYSSIIMISLASLVLLFFIFNEYYNPITTTTSRLRDTLGTIGFIIASISVLVYQCNNT